MPEQNAAPKPKPSWRATGKTAKKFAKELGHDIAHFKARKETPGVRMASCIKCGGCCWISSQNKCGGRALQYHCGTKEARGVL